MPKFTIHLKKKLLLLLLLVLTHPVYAMLTMNLEQASSLVQNTLGGEVIKAEMVKVDGKNVFLIRVINDGRVREVYVDPSNGKISDSK